jgi:uncharacterized protein (DUF58 family)
LTVPHEAHAAAGTGGGPVVTLRAPAVLAVLGLPGLWTPWPWPWLAGAAGVVAVAVLLDLATAGSVREVRCRRSGDDQVRFGGTATVTLTVTNDSLRPLRGWVRDAWVPSAGARPRPPDADPRGPQPAERPAEPATAGGPQPDAPEPSTSGVITAGGRAVRVDLDPGAAADIATDLTPTRRGDRHAVRVTVRSYGPLGCAYRQTTRRQSRRITPPWTLRVLPPFESRRFLPEKLSRLRIIDGQVVTRGRGQGTEFDSLREYVIGDDIRSIDWRATARAEHVVVKTWRPERDRRVLCVLDTGRTSAARVGDEPRLDSAIDAALLLAALAAHAGDRVSTGSHRTLLPKLVDAMATLEPVLSETDFGLVVAEVLHLARRRALVVLFTSLEPGALGEGLLPVLPQLLARHRVVVASVQDPTLDALAAGRGTVPAVYTAAAAEKALAERRRVATALSRYGVHVVEAPTATFASAVADKYLDLKAAGRL